MTESCPRPSKLSTTHLQLMVESSCILTPVPIIVALNKCDKPNIDLDRVKQGLLENNVVLEEYGGEVQAVQVSALKKTGLYDLEEAIVTLSEIMDIRGDMYGSCEAVVIESKLDKGKGYTHLRAF